MAVALALDDDGNVYVTGSSEGPRSRPNDSEPSNGGGGTRFDYATVKYNPHGHPVWVIRYDGPARDIDQATALTLDAKGNVYVTGGSKGIGTDLDYATIKYTQ